MSFPIHYSLIILRFDVIESGILTALINNLKPFGKLSQTRTRYKQAVSESPMKIVPENIYESQALVLICYKGSSVPLFITAVSWVTKYKQYK